ncbi:MAG: hypothetical protein ACJ79K_12610 [Gemmatimonadaceae bacterium]
MSRAIPAFTTLRDASSLVLLIAFTAACPSSRVPSPAAPRPVPTPPPAVVVPPPAASPNVAAPAPHPFAYAPGVYRYEVRTDAVISAEGGSRIDSISTRALITYHIARGDSGMISIAGSVDTFTVTSSRSGAAAPPSVGVPFRMMAFPDGRLVDSTAVDSAAVCATPVSPIVTAGREILAALPIPLAPAAQWTDSTTTVTCRGAVPLIARSVRQSRASWALVPADWSRQASDVAFEVARTTTTIISGQGHVAGRQVDLSGQGQGSSLLYVDPEAGVLLGGTGNGSTKIVVDAGSQRQEFVQTVHQQVRLLR